MTGCPEIPKPDSKFCFKHQEADHPVISGSKMNLRNRDKLRKIRLEESSEAGDDDFYIVESVLDIKYNKKTGWILLRTRIPGKMKMPYPNIFKSIMPIGQS